LNFGSEGLDDDLSTARNRAHRAITEETMFDSRGGRIMRSGTPLETLIQDDVKSEVSGKLSPIDFQGYILLLPFPQMARFRARSAARALEDEEYHQSIGHLKAKVRADIDDNTDHMAFIKRRVVKAVQDEDTAVKSATSLAKWTKVTATHDAESFAAQKAKETKARIVSIEDDMFDRSERQAARDRRTANIKRFIADSNADELSSLRITEKKMVTF
jgi:hypothetical protein